MAQADPRRSEIRAQFGEVDQIFDGDKFALTGVSAAEFGRREFDAHSVEFRHVVA